MQSPQNDDERYMRMALLEAERAFEADEVPVGAIVVCQGRILAKAHNLTETLHDVTAHAEMQALTAASEALGGKYLDQCTLYVTVEPCIMCAGAILNARVDSVVFGADEPKTGAAGSVLDVLRDPPGLPHPQVRGGVLAEAAIELMTGFFADLRA